MQRAFQRHTGVQDFSARDGVSPGICHTVAREHLIEPGDFIQATDSHTCMGGSLGALAYGVGATEYAALAVSGVTFVEVPQSIRFELTGALQPGCTAKDVMLHILANHAKQGLTLDRVMEFGGPGLASLSPDERATLANMATECSAKSGIVEADEATLGWIAARRPGVDVEALRHKLVHPDEGASYDGGVHTIDLTALRPMVATPGDPARGIPSDPTNGALIDDLGDVPIDIAYGGSCTAGKEADLDMYASVMREALAAGRRVKSGVEFYIQFGSESVERYARQRGHTEVFARAGVRVIHPGCGACIGCGPGVSTDRGQVTVSAINRNYQNRSGPGQLYLASPLTVAASAVTGRITAYREGLFRT
jgi:3-isopropylmalate/(R)-2-methylmalate dehydratase large subunit